MTPVVLAVLFLNLSTASGYQVNKYQPRFVVPPSSFQCALATPVATPVWSDTTPKIALTHIFCGEIINSGQAQGFHCLPSGKDPVCVITSGKCTPYNGFECRSNVKIYNADINQYVTKTPIIANQLFFTQSIVDTVNYLITLYKSNKCSSLVAQGKQLCVQDTQRRIAVAMFIVNSSKDILTAYPLRVSDLPSAGCDAQCLYP